MSILVFLIPISLFLGGLGLVACIWTMRSGQYEDLEGAAARILIDDDDDAPGDDDAAEDQPASQRSAAR
ncbi:cbb3-type cytochrome oxidase assembly protein CcoS [Jannaschia ovalis]|uniref:Cbb3-type cytochrome oxidase assembly protein CcoS n=1 Tax=Jannaschia ovalis TaxID=3038773 RepID=A0ABY8LD24_9RHOB|nr:cbb3-type cytochrome oxidase assembly protein CcoS [Jannaschia sp. GRR-S6-38]WGH78074.1 cbb3-type cytochrome oxidase assembly protein CcoS [Jannaschia sp. GRR-S6-38]